MSIKTKDELINKYYKQEVDFLKRCAEEHPITERELFPLPYDGYEMFKHSLSICLIEDIRLKGKRWIKNHETTDDLSVIREDLWKERTKLSNLYGDLDEDDEWFDIINCKCQDTYGFFFTDEKVLKVQVRNCKMATSSVKDIVYLLARRVLNNKDGYKPYVDFN